jgi:ribosomal protein L10
MKPRDSKPTRVEEPKRKGKLSTRKRLMLAVAQEWNSSTSPKLREAYSAKIEWARKLIPKLKKEAEVQEEKEEPT